MHLSLSVLRGSRAIFVCGVSIGILFAFPLAAPLLGGKILEPVATMWGSALGAMAAVASALWVADRQRSQQRRNAAALVHSMFHPIAFHMQEMHDALGRPHGPNGTVQPDELTDDDWHEISNLGQLVIEQHQIFKKRIHRLEAVLQFLYPEDLDAVFFLETEVENALNDSIGDLAVYGATVALGAEARRPTWVQRFSLTVFNGHIQDYLSKLEAAAN